MPHTFCDTPQRCCCSISAVCWSRRLARRTTRSQAAMALACLSNSYARPGPRHADDLCLVQAHAAHPRPRCPLAALKPHRWAHRGAQGGTGNRGTLTGPCGLVYRHIRPQVPSRCAASRKSSVCSTPARKLRAPPRSGSACSTVVAVTIDILDIAMASPPLLIVVLAAGKGVRMRSDLPKVLHPIAGRSMLAHALANARAAGAARLAAVVAPDMDRVRAEAEGIAPGIEVFEQLVPSGTARAALSARPALERHRGDVIVLFADTPLLEA